MITIPLSAGDFHTFIGIIVCHRNATQHIVVCWRDSQRNRLVLDGFRRSGEFTARCRTDGNAVRGCINQRRSQVETCIISTAIRNEREQHAGGGMRAYAGDVTLTIAVLPIQEYVAVIRCRAAIDGQIIPTMLCHDVTRQLNSIILWSDQHQLARAAVAVVAWLIAVCRRATLAAVIVDLERGDTVVESQDSLTHLRYTDGIAVGGIALCAVGQRGSIVQIQVFFSVLVTEIFLAFFAIPVLHVTSRGEGSTLCGMIIHDVTQGRNHDIVFGDLLCTVRVGKVLLRSRHEPEVLRVAVLSTGRGGLRIFYNGVSGQQFLFIDGAIIGNRSSRIVCAVSIRKRLL